jgi:aspartate aminotransferase-like enzyme
MEPETTFGRCFLPGHAEVSPEILRALAHSVIDSDDPEMVQLLNEIQEPLRHLFRTSSEVMVVPGSATGMMEAAVRCGVEERVLVIVGGTWGERFADIAEACGKDVVRVMVHPGKTLEPEHLLQFLDGPEVDAVALVHAETSTGALAPLAELSKVIRTRRHLQILVDAAGSIGGSPVETDEWGLDFVFTSSHKALALPPGIALAATSRKFLDRAKKVPGRGRVLDLVTLAEGSRRAELNSPSLPQLFALKEQVSRIQREGGIESRWRRHHEMLTLLEEWVLVHPEIRLLAPEGRRAWTVSCLMLPAGLKASGVVHHMAEAGWSIASASGELASRAIMIGHMGDAQPADLTHLLSALTRVLGLRDSVGSDASL